MPTTIRLSRGGRKKLAYYSIVVTNSRSPRDSKYIEKIGTFDPLAQDESKRMTLDEARAKYWLSTGAQMSDRVHRFFHKAGLTTVAPHMNVARKPKKAPAEAPAAAPAAEAPAA